MLNKELYNMAKASERSLRIEAGYFDGRFKPKKFLDRKKESSKNKCRSFDYSKEI